jgi:hypothetical protein
MRFITKVAFNPSDSKREDREETEAETEAEAETETEIEIVHCCNSKIRIAISFFN